MYRLAISREARRLVRVASLLSTWLNTEYVFPHLRPGEVLGSRQAQRCHGPSLRQSALRWLC